MVLNVDAYVEDTAATSVKQVTIPSLDRFEGIHHRLLENGNLGVQLVQHTQTLSQVGG